MTKLNKKIKILFDISNFFDEVEIYIQLNIPTKMSFCLTALIFY